MYLELESRCSKVEVAKEKVEREKKNKARTCLLLSYAF
jgi:hypothetical protein